MWNIEFHETNRGAIGIGRQSREQCWWWQSRFAVVWHDDFDVHELGDAKRTAEKDNLVRCQRGFCKRTGLNKNNCPARYNGAFLHFVTSS